MPRRSRTARCGISRRPAAARGARSGSRPMRRRPEGRAGGEDWAPRVPIVIGGALYDALPLTKVADRKPFTLTMARNDRAVMVVERNLDDDERGQYNQRRLREHLYVTRRNESLRDA